ncbi:MAG: polysaccharide deacetylase family protein [Coriobacteriia bacterium]|nr:polysaccharide deacetylase family protein [Coriobacteriia bacterium]
MVVAVLAGAAWWLTGRGGAAARQPLPVAATSGSASTSTAARTTRPSDKAANSSTATSAAASVDAASTAVSPETAAAAKASDSATAKAAQQYPGAPAVAIQPSVNQLKPHHKYIALTLDDGYNFQPDMLAFLKQHDIRCTTFLVGSWAASHKADLKLMRDAGFEIGNHSWTHPFLTRMSASQIQSELSRTQQVISSVTGNQAPYLRPPFGDTNPKVKAAAAALGYRIVMWDRTFGDSGRGATPKKLYANVVTSNGGVQPGDVILCHWGSKPSFEALKQIVPDLQAQGFQFVTISELIADSKPAK